MIALSEDINKIYIELLVEEALNINENIELENELPRKQKIDKLIEIINILKKNPLDTVKNKRITIRYYYKNEYNIETDTARGKEIIIPTLSEDQIIELIIDDKGNVKRL